MNCGDGIEAWMSGEGIEEKNCAEGVKRRTVMKD